MISHQMLNDFIPTTRDHVFWGNVVSNLLRSIELEQLLRPPPGVTRESIRIHGSLLPLGKEGRAAGDPEQVMVTPRGDTVIALAGTGEIALRRTGQRHLHRLAVGRRPTTFCVDETGKTLWVANRFDDTVAKVDLDELNIRRTIPLGPRAPESVVDRGQRLFYDASLALHGWFSCHSCHTDGHSCGLLNDNFGDDTVGAPKRIPSLLGTGGTGPWAWNGTQRSLVCQVHKSLLLTMRGAEQRTAREVDEAAIVAYLNSLEPPPSVARARGELDTQSASRGQRLFTQLQCKQCHAPPYFTSPHTYDVGLRDEHGARHFNPPSLLGVSQRSAFLHDNRAATIRQLLSVHPHPGDELPISEQEMDDLVTFLEGL